MESVLEKSQAVVLHNVSWNSYRTISDTLQDETPAHFTFDRGKLEIMVLSLKHENLKKILAMLFERLCESLENRNLCGRFDNFSKRRFRTRFRT